ncbi:MAG: hypothetical protein Q8O36_06525 [Candidatus Omnitrophota bacterium]|nr:hypothetical protein [Candidatus Omnitrophota bacterium]
MNRLMVIIALALLVITPTIGHAGTISWGYEDWGAANAAPIGWGTWNATFVSNGFGQDGQSTATVTVGNLKPWGKVYYFTGLSSKAIPGSFKYLYINTYDIKGDMKVAISGPGDADFYDVTPHLVSGKTGDPLKKRIYYPGPYVFDLSGWKPLSTHTNAVIQLIGEGGKGKSFTVNRIFISDYNPMAKPKN